MKRIKTPIKEEDIRKLQVGDEVEISGHILCGRDAVLPRLAKMTKKLIKETYGIDLEGSVIFHTAVSPAGIGPTSSNKLEIESSIAPLSNMGVKIHLGKGRLKEETINQLEKSGAAYAVIPPVTALLKSRTLEQKVVAFPEEGMEALYLLEVEKIPVIIAAVHGRSIYF